MKLQFIKILVACLCLATTTVHAKHKKKPKKHASEPAVQQAPSPVIEQVPTQVVQEQSSPAVEHAQAPTPEVQEAPSPVVEQAPTPAVQEVTSPVFEQIPTPVVQEAPSPVVEQAPTPVVQEAPSPVVEQASTPVVQEAPSPVVEQASTQVVQEESSPVVEHAPIQVVQDIPGENLPGIMENPRSESAAYHYIADPKEAFKVAMQFLPEDPVIIDAGAYGGHESSNVTQFDGCVVVQVTTLDAWAKEYDIPKMDMLWIDMQGTEFEALKAAPRLLSGVSVILTKHEAVEAQDGKPLDDQARAWLDEQGFVLFGGNINFLEASLSSRFGDGLFVRKELVRESGSVQ